MTGRGPSPAGRACAWSAASAAGRGDLLDIGPNIGTCLALARERGFRVHGIEINADAARYCREVRGLDVIAGTLEPETYPAGRFDVVLMGPEARC